MKIKDEQLLNIIYLSMTEWLYKIYVHGLVLPRSKRIPTYCSTLVLTYTYDRSTSKYKTFLEFCAVFKYVTMHGDKREFEEAVVLALQAWLQQVYATDSDEGGHIIVAYLAEEKYKVFEESAKITEKLFKWSDNFNDWRYL